MKYTLRQLEVFLAVSHYENVSKAADELAMSQSACSSALKDFESQFDIQLFDRVGKRLQTNEEGRRLRPKAEALVAQAKDLERDLIQHNQVGKLNIGATLTIGNYLCVKLIDEFIKTHPGAKVRLEVANTRRIAEEILNFDIDLGMIEGEFQHDELDVIPWMEDELVCFCSPKHHLASVGHISKDDFLKEKWILREAGSGTRQTFDRAVSGLLSQLDITLELQHTEAIKRAVEADIGISCLSIISLKDAFARGALVPLTCDLDLKRHFYLVIHQQKFRSTGIQRWLELCEKHNHINAH
ncbi:LysR family transcriptional regulator [Saccharophagus degradans]|uniref:LysR substrate-binding domain-containing protein n=1 Tax=Saccharophagus degradans TaxID=86304 RepID=A0AAW7X6U7_9GAMM|nr:LysR substrate-binding domain-containing protein [Saccharophagus degradans]MBU2983793.1 LysR family transcriptional regulator [Saccharophagus degradans]MDO6422233.1 LysR substrate-binding domain-containing protein [Saccharophagus degradans]MDO6607492.1 LysR substrate-binding domain-containing protein [Saccharophagus degradans]